MARHVLEFRSTIEAPVEQLAEWHLRAGAFERLVPPWDGTRVVARSGRIEDDSMRVELSVPLAPGVRDTWKLHHEDYEPGRGFVDVMDRGPFRTWRHEHRFEPDGDGRSVLHDRIEFELVGGAASARIVRRRLERTFAYRHAVTAGDLAAHRASGLHPLRIAITGATGMVGRALAAYLSTAGHAVTAISRSGSLEFVDGDPLGSEPHVRWDPARGELDVARLEGFDAVVHLAGEPIAADRLVPPARWNDATRERIRASRVDGTALLARTLASLDQPPRVLVCASATGFYGDRGETALTESSEQGAGFLPAVATAWEAAADPARAAGIRTVHARIGIVLDPRGGALRQLLTPTRAGIGGPLGAGRQWWSWVLLDDVLGAIEHAIATEDVAGALNVVAPGVVRQRDLARTLGRVLRRPAIAPAPAFALRALLGRGLADELLLASTRVVPEVLERSGYAFRAPQLEAALRHVVGRDAPAPTVTGDSSAPEHALLAS